MAEVLAQLRKGLGVALRGKRIYLGGGTAGDSLEHTKHGPAELQFAADPVELAPGWGAGEPDIGAETPAMAPRTDPSLEIAQAREVDEADDRDAGIGKDVAGDVVEAWCAAGVGAEEIGEKSADLLPAGGRERRWRRRQTRLATRWGR